MTNDPESIGTTIEHPAEVTNDATSPSLQISDKNVFGAPSSDGLNSIDYDVKRKQLEIIALSDQAYREITKDIIGKTDTHLKTLIDSKKPIREKTLSYIRWFLVAQFVVLTIIILLSSSKCFDISTTVITTYIVSVFAETLSGLMAIIHFAFDNTQEVKLIGVLNKIVKRFQKFGDIRDKEE